MRRHTVQPWPCLVPVGLCLTMLAALAALAQPAGPAPRTPGPATTPATPPATPPAPAPLPALGLAAGGVTVSGLSSGGYMAGQFQIAFASQLAGAAVLAAGPYGCTRGQLSTAMRECACPADLSAWLHSVPAASGLGCRVPTAGELAVRAETALAVNRAHLDDPAHLARHRVWLMQAERDPVVAPPLVTAAAEFYRQAGVPAHALKLRPVPGAGHGQPQPGGPVACGSTASPYLTDCDGVDAAGELLAWLYAPGGAGLADPVTPRAEGLRRFDQRPYRRAPASPGAGGAGAAAHFDGLDDSGWLYVPAACEAGRSVRAARRSAPACRLHVVFHGCAQGQGFAGPDGQPVGARFVAGAGYNRWAESNRLVVLYPQVRASTPPPAAAARGQTFQLNPEGCWDFWGYTSPDEALTGAFRPYARRGAPQLAAVKRMVDALLAR